MGMQASVRQLACSVKSTRNGAGEHGEVGAVCSRMGVSPLASGGADGRTKARIVPRRPYSHLSLPSP